MKVSLTLASLVAILPSVLAVSEWGQCGGASYTGSTTCDAGLTCVAVNDSYSQCASATSGSTSGSETGTSTDATETCTGTTKFKYFGVNQSCAEFGTAIPGTLNKDYTWPSPSSVDFFMDKGMNTFRIAFMMERLVPTTGGLTGPFDATYLQGLKTIVSYVTGKGGYAVLDPHNYARYNGSVITDNSAFTTFWTNLAGEFVSDDHVVFDMNNEPYGIPATQAASLMQAGIDGVRAANATQLILVEGTSWTGAWSWITSGNADAFKNLTDPLDNFAFEMHQYLDTDGSGSNATCVSPTVGVERVAISTNWLKENNFKGFLGEMGGGSNDVCVEAVYNVLCHMQQQNGTWLGFAWWAAGPWWGNYFQSIEPPSGPAVSRILPEALLPFV